MKTTHHKFLRLAAITAFGFLFTGSVLAQPRQVTYPDGGTPCPSRTGLYCRMYGSGPPILALHGLGASIYTWRHFAGNPTFKNNRLILIDFRGAGNSPKPHDKKYSLIDQANLIYAFIQEYKLTNLTLMGSSYGGAVSLYLAIRLCKERPNRLAKLILIDSGGYDQDLPEFLKILRTPILGWLAVHVLPPETQACIVLRLSYFDDDKITDEQIAAYAQPIASRGGRHALLQTARQAIPKNVKEIIAEFPTISVPTLILWGGEDEVLPPKLGRMLNAAIPRSQLKLINDCGHVPQEERPQATICLVAEFLGLPSKDCAKSL